MNKDSQEKIEATSPVIVPSNRVEIIEPSADISLKDYDEAVNRLEETKQKLEQRMLNFFMDVEFWKKDVGLPWRLPARKTKSTVYLAEGSIRRVVYAFESNNSTEPRIFLIDNTGNGLLVKEFQKAEDPSRPGQIESVVMFGYDQEAMQTRQFRKSTPLGIGYASAARLSPEDLDRFENSTVGDFNDYPQAFGWCYASRKKSRDFIYKKENINSDQKVDLFLKGEEILRLLSSSKLLGRWDEYSKSIEPVDRQLPDHFS